MQLRACEARYAWRQPVSMRINGLRSPELLALCSPSAFIAGGAAEPVASARPVSIEGSRTSPASSSTAERSRTTSM
eukprot:832331-Prymnesium_polylepis.1